MEPIPIFLIVLLAAGAIFAIARLLGLSPRAAEEKAAQDAKMFCPHCLQFGHVTTEPTTVKKGISDFSTLDERLAQEDTMTKATCANCGSTWLF